MTELTDKNDDKINKLQTRNSKIDEIIEREAGAIKKRIKELDNINKSAETFLDISYDKMISHLKKHGFSNLKQVKAELDKLNKESKDICSNEQV